MPRTELERCQAYVLDAFQESARQRDGAIGLEWIEKERAAVAVAANVWAAANGITRQVTLDEVEACEQRAVGHIDYADKLAYGVAELVTAPPS